MKLNQKKKPERMERRRLKTMERIWVQDTPKLHALNYWWYRYFTNEFELYILDAIQFKKYKKSTRTIKTKYGGSVKRRKSRR